MYTSITIERDVSYIGRKDTFTIENGDKSIPITHVVGGFMHKKVKPETKKLSHKEFRPIFDAFNTLDFTKIYQESGDLVGCDGWTLRCTISNVMSEISVQVWCPSESPETPATTKLLQACNMVFDLFPEEEENNRACNQLPNSLSDVQRSRHLLSERVFCIKQSSL